MPQSNQTIDHGLLVLSKSDWQFIHEAVVRRYNMSDPKPGEPPASKSYREEKSRILGALMNKAYGYNYGQS